VQFWEAGDRFPWPRFLQKLCRVLEVTTTDFVKADEWPARRPGKEAAAAIA